MRLLADHNVEAPIVARLREAGHDLLAVAEEMAPESPDDEVLARATKDERVLLTNDKDFGELAFLQRKASSGILLMRMSSSSSSAKADRLLSVLNLLGDRLRGALVVVTEERIRRRALPDFLSNR